MSEARASRKGEYSKNRSLLDYIQSVITSNIVKYATTVILLAWEQFSSVCRTAYYFINCDKKGHLYHHPIDQFNGSIATPSQGVSSLPRLQKKNP
jgi:hypothetical protein